MILQGEAINSAGGLRGLVKQGIVSRPFLGSHRGVAQCTLDTSHLKYEQCTLVRFT